MSCADLHVHCKESKRPAEWFLQKVGAQESYTKIDTLYRKAKQFGMDFVTITDHNTIDGALELVDMYPEDTFISVEVTTYFPENKCKIHILLYDINTEIFAQVEQLRHNIYALRDYIQQQDIAYSVAHGFYSVNKRLDLETIEKLILLFDIFEGLNGARNRHYNETWQRVLQSLTPQKIRLLKSKHSIEPISSDPWVKGFTGGSDDHAGLFIGQTSTVSTGSSTRAQFIQSIKNKETVSHGRCNDFKSFAFSIYKIFCDYSTGAQKNSLNSLMTFINSVVFEDSQSRLKQWLTLRKVKKGKRVKDKIILKFLEDITKWSQNPQLGMEDRIEQTYRSMGLLLDELFRMLLDSFVNDFSKGDVGKLFRNLMSALPAFFISIPFFSSLKHLSQDREMIFELKKNLMNHQSIKQKKVLWFTDTFNDLNGVSVTLNRFKDQCEKKELNITFVVCVPREDQHPENSTHVMYLPSIDSVCPDFYPTYSLNFPSLLASIEMIYQQQPDRIVVSTPGPVGLLGMVMASMMGIECVTIYHTDFAAQAQAIFNDDALSGIIRSFVNRFYSFSTHIKVPTKEYIQILEQQNFDPDKMSTFKRGITVKPMNPNPLWKNAFREKNNFKKGTTLLWAGRVSKDKNIDFLLDTYEQASVTVPDLNLILCGNGPDFDHYQSMTSQNPRIHFMGSVENKKMSQYYEYADLFVFPSTTDTFGMVVLEAQSCGLPALVTDVGGPQEIIVNHDTGSVLSLSDIQAWVTAIEKIDALKTQDPNEHAMMRARCQNHIHEEYGWDEALYSILEPIPSKIPDNPIDGILNRLPSDTLLSDVQFTHVHKKQHVRKKQVVA